LSSSNVDSAGAFVLFKVELDEDIVVLLLILRCGVRTPSADDGRVGALTGGRRCCALSNLDK